MPNKRIVAIGAHPDDIELGCGGTLARHRAVGDEVVMLVMTNGQSGPGEVAGRLAEASAAAAVLGAEVRFGGFKDGDLTPNRETVAVIEDVLREIHPSVIYTHAENDSHQDHRCVAEATLSAARNFSTILHYQAPSTREFSPHFFVALDDASLDLKIQSLMAHESQVAGSLRVDVNAVDATARYWGSAARTQLAEGFEVTRALVNPTEAGIVVGDRRAERTSYVGPDRRKREPTLVEKRYQEAREAAAKRSDTA